MTDTGKASQRGHEIGPEALRSNLVERAESDRHFLGSALAAWRSAHPDVEPHDLLRCRKEDLWRIALAPRPKNEAEVAATAKRIADAFAIEVDGLISLLRLADAVDALTTPTSRSAELLMAARDRSDKEDDPSDESDRR
jgi:hypothetical protein